MNTESIGFLEFSSIAKGIEAADTVLKAAAVDVLFAHPVCPGKYSLLFAGEVAAVKASLEAGIQTGGASVVDSVVIPRLHPQVLKAIGSASLPPALKSLGVMEFFSITAAVHAADAAVKTANVDLIDLRLGTGIGGKSLVLLTGEVAAVKEAISSGIAVKSSEGLLVASVVIPNPHGQLFETLI